MVLVSIEIPDYGGRGGLFANPFLFFLFSSGPFLGWTTSCALEAMAYGVKLWDEQTQI